MNNTELKFKLAAQRKWREAQPAQTFIRQRGERQWVAIGLLIFTLIAASWFSSTRSAAPAVVLVSSTNTMLPPITPSPVPVTLKVCADNLHVRYTPNGSVRGYLKAGEVVELKLDTRGMNITRTQDNENWTLIAAPVEGWANSKYLCK